MSVIHTGQRSLCVCVVSVCLLAQDERWGSADASLSLLHLKPCWAKKVLGSHHICKLPHLKSWEVFLGALQLAEKKRRMHFNFLNLYNGAEFRSLLSSSSSLCSLPVLNTRVRTRFPYIRHLSTPWNSHTATSPSWPKPKSCSRPQDCTLVRRDQLLLGNGGMTGEWPDQKWDPSNKGYH